MKGYGYYANPMTIGQKSGMTKPEHDAWLERQRAWIKRWCETKHAHAPIIPETPKPQERHYEDGNDWVALEIALDLARARIKREEREMRERAGLL